MVAGKGDFLVTRRGEKCERLTVSPPEVCCTVRMQR